MGGGGKQDDGPDVSIVVTSHNYGWCLRDALDSALGQVGVRHEVIVVDDGSTDDSRSVLSEYDGVRTILQENAGQAVAMNTGFAAARAAWILFLDADDRLHPTACARALSRARPGLSKVQFRLDVVDRAGISLGYTHPGHSYDLPEGSVVPDLVRRGRYVTPMTSGNLYSRAALERVMPIQDPRFATAGDGYLNTLVPFHGEVASLQESLGDYRLHGGNIWSMTRIDPSRIGAFVRHDEDRYRLIRAQEAGLGVRVVGHPGERDWLHMRHRLAAQRLTGRDPVAEDFGRPRSTLSLVLRAVLSLRGWRGRPSWRDGALAVWFVVVGLSRGRLLQRLLQVAYVPGSRGLLPGSLCRMVARLRPAGR